MSTTTTIFLLVSSMAFCWSSSTVLAKSTSRSPYRIIIDGGSTGSRLHVFEFVPKAIESNGLYDDDVDGNDVSEHDEPLATDCVRRGSSRANIPLSAFGRLPSEQHTPLNETHVAAHMLPLFEYAANVIPPEYHNITGVKYQATAGMRLLDLSEQEAVYDALFSGLMQADTFVFRGMKRSDIATLSGELEGFYGAVAANYLTELVDTNMRLVAPSDDDDDDGISSPTSNYPMPSVPSGPIGALDMGGSSTQIVFLTSDEDTKQSCDNTETSQSDAQTCENVDFSMPSRLHGDDFFSTSYLSYGVDQFRERLWNTWVQERRWEGDNYDSCASKSIPNPCSNPGYKQQWDGFTLIGTGDTDECIRQVQRLIPHPEEASDVDGTRGRKVGGVEHPPVRGKFFAMSLYFFTLDSLRVLSHPKEDAHKALNLSWPTPSIEELHNALDGLCSRSWEGDLEEIQDNAHKFTRREVLPHRCLESVYMVTLLRDGFGFHPSSRDITFTFLVDGSEVEWTLGMAIALNAAEVSQRDNVLEDQRRTLPTKSSSSRENHTTYDDDSEDQEKSDGDDVGPVISADTPFSAIHFLDSR